MFAWGQKPTNYQGEVPSAMGHVRTWKPTGRQGPPSLFREFEQPVIARMIADVIEIGIVLEPEFLVGSEQRKTGLQQVDGPIELA